MAEAGVTANHKKLSCSICLDLLKYPVTIPCGHNYCMDCITNYWDTQQNVYTCPQCRRYFVSRPIVMKNTLLEDLVEELKTASIQTQAGDINNARSQDVFCDVCNGKKLKALKSCMQCLASFCKEHLQPHYRSPAFTKHQLTEPSKKLQESICPLHKEPMKIFCRNDQRCICYLCSVDEHRSHDTVSTKTERAQKQKELEALQQKILQKIHNKEKVVEVLQQEEITINSSADEAVSQSNKEFLNLTKLMKDRKRKTEKQIRAQQQIEVRRVQELKEKLNEEIAELKISTTELETLSQTPDDIFLHNFFVPPELKDIPETYSIQKRPLQYFRDVTAAVSILTKKLQYNLNESLANVSNEVGCPEPKTREDFLRYSRNITLDPNTAHSQLALSDSNKRVTLMKEHFAYPSHPDRFQDWRQVLSKDSLTGRCYWEVEWSGEDGVYIAVAYKSIKRQGSSTECLFGYNDKSWALYGDKSGYVFWFNGVSCPVSGPKSSKVGVYLDHTLGVLSFYSVAQTMTLLHKVQTAFTQPLHAGLWLYYPQGSTAAFCKLK